MHYRCCEDAYLRFNYNTCDIIKRVLPFRIKGCQVWGSRTSIPTSYLKSAGLNTPGVKFSSYSVKPLPRYYSIQTGSKVGTENHNLGNPSHLMT